MTTLAAAVKRSGNAAGRRYWLLLGVAVLALKLLLYWLDPVLLFFLGDSQSYLYTSLSGWIPPDRSWAYGRWLREVTLGNQTLDTIVPVQMLLATATCLLAAFVLVRFLGCSRGIAALVALLCAIEPLQLMYERFVMTETISLLFFALFLIGLLYYLQRGRAEFLFAAAVLGAVTLALRYAYMPVLLGTGVLAILWFMLWGDESRAGTDPQAPPAPGRAARAGLAGVQLLLFLLTLFMLLAYDPARKMASEDGFFLLTAWSPLLAREEAPKDPLLEQILGEMDPDCTLDTVMHRDSQQWLEQCLCGRLKTHFPDRLQANAYARQTALGLLRDDPLGVLGLGVRTWRVVWDDVAMVRVLSYDRGALEPYPQAFVDLMQDSYGVNVAGRNAEPTLTGRYFEMMIGWLRWVAVAPLALLLWLLLHLRQRGSGRTAAASLLITAAALALLAVVTIAITVPAMRFYHGIAWLSLIGLGSMLDRLVHWRSSGDEAP